MKKVLEKGLFLLSIYMVFTAYLFLASDRIENLENSDDIEYVNVAIKYHDWLKSMLY